MLIPHHKPLAAVTFPFFWHPLFVLGADVPLNRVFVQKGKNALQLLGVRAIAVVDVLNLVFCRADTEVSLHCGNMIKFCNWLTKRD